LTALAFHNEQLQASAFREQYDPESFEDLTLPKYEMISKVSRCGILRFFLMSNVGSGVLAGRETVHGVERSAYVRGFGWCVRDRFEAQGSKIDTLICELVNRCIQQEVGIDEAEIRSKNEVGMLGKVSLVLATIIAPLVNRAQFKVDQLKVYDYDTFLWFPSDTLV
jgi:hypothetical protein